MIYAQDIIDAHKVEIDRLRAELAKFDGMLPVPAEDANDLDDVVRELGIEASETTPAEAVRELKAEIDRLHAELAELAEANNLDRVALFEKSINDRDARIATLEAAGNRLGDAAVDGVLTSIEAVTELAEAKARIAELEELEADALQCASVEADLRREFRARAEKP